MKKLKKQFKLLLFTMLLGPLFPVFGAVGDGGDDGTGGDGGTGGDSSSNVNNDFDGNAGEDSDGENLDGESNSSSNSGTVTMTQAEYEKSLDRRVKRALRKQNEEFEKQRKKANLSETERLKLEKEEAETKAIEAQNKANKILIKANIINECSELGINSKAAIKLMEYDEIEVDEEGNVIGVQKALKALLKDFPFIKINNSNNNPGKPGGDDQNRNPHNNVTSNMDALIRRAVGR